MAVDVHAPALIDRHLLVVYGPMAAPKGRNKIATETSTLKVGDAAPDFKLRAHDGTEVVLSAYRGRRVVLAFFAFAFTNT